MVYNILLSVGVIILLIALFVLNKAFSFLKSSERAIATVVDIETVHDNDGNTYKPVFKFRTSLNREITYHYEFSSSPASWDMGDEANIAYDPNDPEKVTVLTYFGTFGWAAILLSIAAPLIIIGGGYHLSKLYLG